MRWPIRNQILIPFALVLSAAVAVTSVSSSVRAARRAERDIVGQINRILVTLSGTSFPWSRNVLETMRGLSGAEFVVYGEPPISTLGEGSDYEGSPPPQPPSMKPNRALAALSDAPVLVLDERRYFAAVVQRTGVPRGATASGATMLVLYPVDTWEQARNEAAWPPLVVGGATLVLLAVAALVLANRLASRLRRVEQQVAQIAGGEFQEVDVDARNDEIQDLARSVNRMSQQLRSQRELLGQTERTRLLGQLAGGLAHQLRNAATGARMAVQIHARRCERAAADDSLDVALRQLALMEEQVRGLLAVGKTERRAPVKRPLRELLADVSALVGPACAHHGICWTVTNGTTAERVVDDAEGLRTALVNLALNAIDAAGANGEVTLTATESDDRLEFDVCDTGPGPPPEIAGKLFELFVTGRPEGVGFGLALAKQVADQLGGSLGWSRENDRTRFRLALPLTTR